MELPDWNHAFGGPLGRAEIRSVPEDFCVSEDLGFDPDGEGSHWLLHVRKRGANTTWVGDQLADFAAVSRRDVGFSGMKDRNAVTEQWFSVPVGATEPDWSQCDIEGVEILDSSRHGRKLRRGSHIANEFVLVLRNVSVGHAELDQRLETIAAEGVPNYFGPQRFGRDGANIDRAREWLIDGARGPRRNSRGIILSAARSWLFNAYLSNRVASDSWNRPQPADWLMLDGTNSVFRYSADDERLQTRCAEQDLHPAGPLWGHGGGYPDFDDAELAALARGLMEQGRLQHRSMRLLVEDLSWSWPESNTLQLEFALPAGGFATAVLRELVQVNHD